MGKQLYFLFEHAPGYALFERIEGENIGSDLGEARKSFNDIGRFSKMCKLHGFIQFTSPEEVWFLDNFKKALENQLALDKSEIHPVLKNFLKQSLPKVKNPDKAGFILAVCDSKLGAEIRNMLRIPCMNDSSTRAFMRAIRIHYTKFLEGIDENQLRIMHVGLGHHYSRTKISFNINRVDNMIIQAICLLEQLDIDLNRRAMRSREWYSNHFPELIKIVPDNVLFGKLALAIKDKAQLTEEMLPKLTEITENEDISREILEVAKNSMGQEMSEVDMNACLTTVERFVSLADYRTHLHEYLIQKMNQSSPGLQKLLGEMIGGKLIAKAGSLTNLAKNPASKNQILGAEKALFRSIKNKDGRTPKYGILFNSSFVQKADPKNRGKMARFLANKITMVARFDAFCDVPSSVFGEGFYNQATEKLKSFTNPKMKVSSNESVLEEACNRYDKYLATIAPESKNEMEEEEEEEVPSLGKRKKVTEDEEEEEEEEQQDKPKKKKKKKKSEKKSKKKKSEKKSSKKKSKKKKKKKAEE